MQRPHVALIVKTSLASGREILRGIASYLREHRPWSIYHEPRDLKDAAPRWLRVQMTSKARFTSVLSTLGCGGG